MSQSGPGFSKSPLTHHSTTAQHNESPSLPGKYRKLATEALKERDIYITDELSLVTAVGAAIQALSLYFNSSPIKPTQNDLDLFFQDFILWCFVSCNDLEAK